MCYISIHMGPDEGQITSKVPHTQHSPHRSLTLFTLHIREHDRKRHWADPKMHSLHSDGQPVHPYQAGAAHTHDAPDVMPPSVGYLHSVKISAYHTNVPKERGGDIGEQRGKRGVWVGRGGGRRGESVRVGRRGRGGEDGRRERVRGGGLE